MNTNEKIIDEKETMRKNSGHVFEERNGELFIGGVSAFQLAKKHGTPIYVMDEERVRSNYRRMRDAFRKRTDRVKIHYSVKSNNNLSILNILRQEGAGADCSCIEEVEMARMCGFAVKDLLYTGNYNSYEELDYARRCGINTVLDDISLVKKLMELEEQSPEMKNHNDMIISFRINPGIGEGGAKGLVFAGKDVKFGIEETRAVEAYKEAKKLNPAGFGIHAMPGSCVIKPEYFGKVTEEVMRIAGKIADEAGIEFEFVNIGGGFGVPYRPEDDVLDIDMTAEYVVNAFNSCLEKYNLGNPILYLEPGRYIGCDAGALITKVHSIKETDSGKFIGTDVGMNTLLRPALYDAYHHIRPVIDNGRPEETVSVTGQICENTDRLARNRQIPEIRQGEYLAIFNTGSYGYSMSSQYNSRPRAPEILVSGGNDYIIRRRESLMDLLSTQSVPRRLRE